ncbi:uncharacterized protein LOC125228022 [Leguminivora glycinivorella]|uniref:uncharacterized protein LOC125228022 n=1 Tax=Leguminivora glycinivorella TaxID=1035111 RepID=UPI00200FE825|nr:uncharacterized protein LOC125228022 [Leguminivora glycinivorella]
MRNLFSTKKIQTESANAVRHLLDTTSTCLKSLQNMGITTSTWDVIIVYLVITKLDAESIKQWEQHLNMLGDDLPTWEQLREFLEYRFRSLEMIDTNTSRPAPPAKPAAKVKTFHTAIENKVKTSDIECAMCHEIHHIYQCKQFGSMTPQGRQDFVQNNKLCFNCLMPTHSVLKCRLTTSCRKCGRRHHTLLHFDRDDNQEARVTSEVAASSASPSAPLPEKLNKPRATKLNVQKWSEIEDLPLADPEYSTPGKIDILLGAEVYAEIILAGLFKKRAEGRKGTMIAQNTMLGWIVSGRAVRGSETQVSTRLISMHVHIQEDDLLKKFWEMENEPNSIEKEMTKSEQQCEEFFNSTTVRDDDGRLVVRLPFSTEDPKCQYGNSKEIAIKRLEILERKLLREPKLREEYNKVMEEYLSLNHMRAVSERELENHKAVYLPFHAVIREDKETTKFRIVFNASSKGDNNISLNDDLLVGPKLQQDLRHILMRARSHKICLVADIIKMYRMIRVAEEDTDFQRIVWRFKSDGSEPIQHYKLLRLTFGTACAPYLAVKSLQKLAELEESKYPLAARITKRDFYMDDLITGAETEAEALRIFNEMNELMRSGGFELQKWNTNSKTLLDKIVGNKESSDQTVHLKLNHTMKVLGVSWNRDTDNFEYTLNLSEVQGPITKRKVLSDVARLYDPLGWIAPVVVIAKIFIQKLWKSGLEWDSPLTEELVSEWLSFREALADLKQLAIPRWLNATPRSEIELHVFADASKSAFAAAVYVRVVEHNGVHVHLVTGKTKVAPTEREISIPRLELCAAALAAKLIFEVAQRDERHVQHC